MQEHKKSITAGDEYQQDGNSSAAASVANSAANPALSKQQRLASALQENLKRRKASSLKRDE